MLLYGIRQKTKDRIVYVGITTKTITWRWRRHLEESRSPSPRTLIARAIKKYGPADFEISQIGWAVDIEALKALECQAIERLDTYVKDGGYNLTRGGDGIWGYRFDPELVAAIKEKRRGFRHSAETRALISEANRGTQKALGYRHTEDAKRRISAAFAGEKHPNYGKKRPAQVIEKMRASAMGRPVSNETREKIRSALAGKPKNDMHRAALSVAAKGRPKTEAHKAALKAAWERRRLRKRAG